MIEKTPSHHYIRRDIYNMRATKRVAFCEKRAFMLRLAIATCRKKNALPVSKTELGGVSVLVTNSLFSAPVALDRRIPVAYFWS
jgi:hypothetical protein